MALDTHGYRRNPASTSNPEPFTRHHHFAVPLDEQPEDSVVPPEHRESAPSLAHLLTVVPGTSRVHPVRPSVQPDHAGIDHDNNRPVWWIDLDDGTRTILLTEVTLEDAATVAARIIASTT